MGVNKSRILPSIYPTELVCLRVMKRKQANNLPSSSKHDEIYTRRAPSREQFWMKATVDSGLWPSSKSVRTLGRAWCRAHQNLIMIECAVYEAI